MRLSLVTPAEFRNVIRSLPPRSRLLVCVAAFSFFSIMGFVNDMMGLGARPGWRVTLDVLISGGMAVVYLFAIIHSLRLLAIVVIAHVASTLVLNAVLPVVPDVAAGEALRTRMTIDGAGIIIALSVGYTCAVTFTSIESARFQRIQTEVRLAGEIHQSLVPPLAGRVGAFEYAGVSHPSGTVGGDLIDVVEYPQGWVAYLVDVSGHGVRAGVLMGMVKSAVRMAFRRPAPLGRWLTEVNDVLHPLRASSMYATVAAVQSAGAGTLSFSVAGHLPILHVRADNGRVDEQTIPQVPLALFEHREFDEAPLTCGVGDVLVLLTDGLTEVFDAKDQELGLDAAKRLVAERRGEPLSAIAEALVAQARHHGPQQDDQTVLLLRRLA